MVSREIHSPSRQNWKYVHVLVWEEHHGPVPPGHCVAFCNGDKGDIRVENLELLTRAERMRRNTIHRYPPELRSAIRLVGKLNRVVARAEEGRA